jgi:hypothetical protein
MKDIKVTVTGKPSRKTLAEFYAAILRLTLQKKAAVKA